MDSPIDPSVLREKFSESALIWIEQAYKYAKKNNLSLIHPNLQNFVKNNLLELLSDWNKTITNELFDIMIKIIFTNKVKEQPPIYQFGVIHRAFHNIIQFQILKETLEFVKTQLIEYKCDYNWIDVSFLKGLYKKFDIKKEKELRFITREIILIALRNKERKLRDIKISLVYK
ncbi:MAG: hypothetical protein ACFFD2_11630 [Promethearchaeota archaeon]